MKYTWNIRKWIERIVMLYIRDEVIIAWVYVLLKPVEDIHGMFMDASADVELKLRYNGQTMVMAALLNKLFDPTNKLIRIETDSDNAPAAILWDESDGERFEVLWDESEPGRRMVLWDESDVYKSGAFTVYVPTSLAGNEDEIRAWVDYYRAAGSYFTIKYF